MVPVDQPTLMNRFTNQLVVVKPFSNEYAKEALLEMIISNNHFSHWLKSKTSSRSYAVLQVKVNWDGFSYHRFLDVWQ
ncbi:hypothetical protein DAPPUDRAFT_322240 [Daphnia pulex]|uniref:Uncharacterized protein n=1 Tax=Daphnia pulex TaxID=6669 RepID=E9GVB6_DAPPU|nr:hypothetical protein DAPPUDRAFT_341139 [Daphnia pulex]EFX76628.1 hypothetical protein DAPPUDRAFT_322240 [Daphnia pulex]|eukprot:EFX60862.1 hypothetical protein DAPPUDRAFT_341139 [Daphnia pulex]